MLVVLHTANLLVHLTADQHMHACQVKREGKQHPEVAVARLTKIKIIVNLF